jgi:hypothetical protein
MTPLDWKTLAWLIFDPGHLVMVAVHGWSNFASMWTGGRRQYL